VENLFVTHKNILFLVHCAHKISDSGAFGAWGQHYYLLASFPGSPRVNKNPFSVLKQRKAGLVQVHY